MGRAVPHGRFHGRTLRVGGRLLEDGEHGVLGHRENRRRLRLAPAVPLAQVAVDDDAPAHERGAIRAAQGCASCTTPLVWSFRQVSGRSEEHTSELQSLMRISYAVICL